MTSLPATIPSSCTPTTSTTATCLLNSQGFYFESGYNTFTGYDLATGLGSVDATLLVNDWTSASGSLSVANCGRDAIGNQHYHR